MSEPKKTTGQKQSSYQPQTIRRWFGKGFSSFLVVASGIAFYFLLLRLGEISSTIKAILGSLRPVLYGIGIAYLLNPLMKVIENRVISWTKDKMEESKSRKLARTVGVVGAMLILIFIIVMLFNMILPELYRTIRKLIIVLPRQVNVLVNSVNSIDPESTLGKYGVSLVEQANEWFQNWVRGDFLGDFDKMLGNVTNGIIDAVGTVVNLLIGLIIACYLLYGKDKFLSHGKKILFAITRRQKANLILDICRKSNRIFSNFLIGKLIDSLIIGIICFIGMSIFHISEQYTLLVSVFVGVTNIIPFFGPYIGAVPSAILILLEDPMHCVYFLIFILILQQVDGNIIGPKILGDSTGLSSFWVIFAILVFGGLFGVLGMIIGVPTFAVIYMIISMYTDEHLERKGIQTESALYTDLIEIKDDGTFVYADQAEEKQSGFIKRLQKFKKRKEEEESSDTSSNKE